MAVTYAALRADSTCATCAATFERAFEIFVMVPPEEKKTATCEKTRRSGWRQPWLGCFAAARDPISLSLTH
jgi:hypothetical protein